MDWMRHAQHLEFSCRSDIHSSGVQSPALKFKVDTYFRHYLQPSEGHNSETTLQKAYVHITFFFFLYCGADSPSLGLAVHFSFTLYTPQIREELLHMKFCSTM
jgi:hypothetical protein